MSALGSNSNRWLCVQQQLYCQVFTDLRKENFTAKSFEQTGDSFNYNYHKFLQLYKQFIYLLEVIANGSLFYHEEVEVGEQ